MLQFLSNKRPQREDQRLQKITVICYLLSMVFIFLFLLAPSVFAQATPEEQFAAQVALPTGPAGGIAQIIANIINIALGFLGMVAVIVILYGGFVWMTSGGNEEKIAKAKKTLINGAIGLGLILGAFAIAQFVFRMLLGIAPEFVPSPASPRAPSRVGGGALGSGIIESHYPFRGQIGVPRNTKIVITFKEPIQADSIAQNNVLRDDAIHLARTDVEKIDTEGRVTGEKIGVTFTEDLRTVVLSSAELLGNSAENVPYMVYLCGTKTTSPVSGSCQSGGIKLTNGAPAFEGRFNDYQWTFETGTFLDLTPPTITSVLPIFDNEIDESDSIKDRRDKPRNTIIQINFDEPILPTVVSGKTKIVGGAIETGSFDKLRVSADNGATFLAGEWQIGNQYKTSEFASANLCGKNACGQDVFCLPGPSQILVQIQTASLANPTDTKSFVSAGLLDGAEDLAGNAMDGKKDGVAKGLTDVYNLNNEIGDGDNVRWSFFTAGYIDLTSPIMEDVSPEIEGAGVVLTAPVETAFNKPMSITTLNSRNIDLSGQESATAKPWDTWWIVGGENIDENNDNEPEKTKGIIRHGGFWDVSDFQTQASQGVKDIYQNCFYPSGGQTVCTGSSPEGKPYCCNGQWRAEKCF